MRRLRVAALAPRLIWQGLQTRRHALHLPEASGPRHETSGTGPPLSLLIVGDSSAAGVGVDQQRDALAGQIAQSLSTQYTFRWELRARTGATTRSALACLRDNPPGPADAAMIVLGVNDVTRMVPVNRWLDQQRALVDLIIAHANPRCIYIPGVPPMGIYPLLPDPLRGVLGDRAAAFDHARTTGLTHDPRIIHVPLPGPFDPALMASDGYHPGAAAYAIWGQQMASRIASDWP